jgi:hypothetical protein
LVASGNITARAEAVWDEETLVSFELNPEPGLSAVQVGHQRMDGATASIKVHTITLDHYFASHLLPNLIKIDVEGAELQVLKGATSILSLPPLRAPLVVFEYGSLNARRFGYVADDTLKFLREHGYAIYTLHRGALLWMDEPPVLPEMDSTCNLLASKLPLKTSSNLRDSQ